MFNQGKEEINKKLNICIFKTKFIYVIANAPHRVIETTFWEKNYSTLYNSPQIVNVSKTP